MMTKQSVNWSEGLAKDLKDSEFAVEFITGLIDEGETLKDALAMTVKAYGVTEFSNLVGLHEFNIHRALSQDSNPTEQTLEKILSPFGLSLGIKKKL